MGEALESSGSADGMLEWSGGAGREPARVVESADGRTGGVSRSVAKHRQSRRGCGRWGGRDGNGRSSHA